MSSGAPITLPQRSVTTLVSGNVYGRLGSTAPAGDAGPPRDSGADGGGGKDAGVAGEGGVAADGAGASDGGQSDAAPESLSGGACAVTPGERPGPAGTVALLLLIGLLLGRPREA